MSWRVFPSAPTRWLVVAHAAKTTAIAVASDPVRMARAFKAAVEAGRDAYELGLAPRSHEAQATSPLTGFLER